MDEMAPAADIDEMAVAVDIDEVVGGAMDAAFASCAT